MERREHGKERGWIDGWCGRRWCTGRGVVALQRCKSRCVELLVSLLELGALRELQQLHRGADVLAAVDRTARNTAALHDALHGADVVVPEDRLCCCWHARGGLLSARRGEVHRLHGVRICARQRDWDAGNLKKSD